MTGYKEYYSWLLLDVLRWFILRPGVLGLMSDGRVDCFPLTSVINEVNAAVC